MIGFLCFLAIPMSPERAGKIKPEYRCNLIGLPTRRFLNRQRPAESRNCFIHSAFITKDGGEVILCAGDFLGLLTVEFALQSDEFEIEISGLSPLTLLPESMC